MVEPWSRSLFWRFVMKSFRRDTRASALAGLYNRPRFR